MLVPRAFHVSEGEQASVVLIVLENFVFIFSRRLYEVNVEDTNEIDWEDLASAIG